MRDALYITVTFVLLALVSGSDCIAATASNGHLWPLRFKPSDPSQMEVKYELQSNADGLKIAASIGYLNSLKSGTPITARKFWYSPFSWSMPRLSIKTENSTDHEILLEKVLIKINASEVDHTPIPIIYEDLIREIGFYNDGWGDLIDTELEVGLLQESYCDRNEVIVDRSNFVKIKLMKLGRITSDYTVNVGDLIKAGKFKGTRACGIGVLSYKDENGSQWRVPFRAGVWLGQPLVGAPAPPNTTYDLFLPAGKFGYTTEVPLSQSVPAKGVDHFQIAIYSDKSSSFDFKATVLSSRGKEVAKSNVKLIYFRPRSTSKPTTPLSKYKDIDSRVFASMALAPYITAIRYEPIEPKMLEILATDEWMLLTNGRRNAVHAQIEKGLAKLGLPGAHYCYRLASGNCARSGDFEWNR